MYIRKFEKFVQDNQLIIKYIKLNCYRFYSIGRNQSILTILFLQESIIIRDIILNMAKSITKKMSTSARTKIRA